MRVNWRWTHMMASGFSHDQDTIHAEKGVCRSMQFPHGCLDVPPMSWDKSKNPCPCRNHTFSNSVHQENLKNTCPVASCFPGPDDAPHWEMCDLHMGPGSCYSTEYNASAFMKISQILMELCEFSSKHLTDFVFIFCQQWGEILSWSSYRTLDSTTF